MWTLGLKGLSNNDGNSYENVTEKANSRCLKLYRVYSISFNSSNAGKFFSELNSKGFYQSSEKEKKVVVSCSRPRQNTKLGTSTLCVQRRLRNVQKSVMHVQSC